MTPRERSPSEKWDQNVVRPTILEVKMHLRKALDQSARGFWYFEHLNLAYRAAQTQSLTQVDGFFYTFCSTSIVSTFLFIGPSQPIIRLPIESSFFSEGKCGEVCAKPEVERKGERDMGSEALAEAEKNRKRPSRESNPGPQQMRPMLYHWATETSDLTGQFASPSLFEIQSTLPPLHFTSYFSFSFPVSFPFSSTLRLSFFFSQAFSLGIHFNYKIDHFTYYCLGSQGGKLWVVMRLLGPIACRKVCRNTAEICKTTGLSFWNVGFQFQLFLQTIGLDAATFSPLTGLRSIVSPLELNVRVRSRRRSSLPSQTLLQLPSRKARQVREELAEAGKQIEEHKKRAWGRNGASTCLLECENASSKVAPSHTLFWERERKRRLAEAFFSGLSVVQWEALWKALGIELTWRRKSSAKSVLRTRKEAGRTWEVLVGCMAVVTLEDQLLVMTRLRIRLGWLQQELAYIFGVSEAGVWLTFQEVD